MIPWTIRHIIAKYPYNLALNVRIVHKNQTLLLELKSLKKSYLRCHSLIIGNVCLSDYLIFTALLIMDVCGVTVAHPPGVGEVMCSILGPNRVIAKVVPTAAMSDARH